MSVVVLAGTAWVLLRAVQRLGFAGERRLVHDSDAGAAAALAGSVAAALALFPVPVEVHNLGLTLVATT